MMVQCTRAVGFEDAEIAPMFSKGRQQKKNIHYIKTYFQSLCWWYKYLAYYSETIV